MVILIKMYIKKKVYNFGHAHGKKEESRIIFRVHTRLSVGGMNSDKNVESSDDHLSFCQNFDNKV